MTVFLSYSRRDAELVNRIYRDLLAQGIQVWMDRNAIEAGSLWRTSIVDGIKGCRVFLLIVSAASQQSRNVAKEVSLAESNGKPIVPLKIDDTPILADFGYSLAGIQFVDMNHKGYKDSLLEILNAIQRLASAPAIAVPRSAAPDLAKPPFAGLAIQQPLLGQTAVNPNDRSGAVLPEASVEQSREALSGEQESATLISQESLAGLHQVVAEELGPIVQLLWSEDFARDLLSQPQAIKAKLLTLGVPEATAFRLRCRLEPFLRSG